MRQNEELNDLTLSGLVMSVMPARLSSLITDGGSSVVERRVEAVLAWYKKTFSLEHIKFCSNIRLVMFCSFTSANQVTPGYTHDYGV